MYCLPINRGVGLSGVGSLVTDISAGITRQENANPAFNNPGNLRAGPGQTGTSANGIAIFPDWSTGEAALERQVQLNIDRGLTLSEFFGGKPGVYPGYAPAADSNQPNIYTAHVSSWEGIPADVPLSQLQAGYQAADSGAADLFPQPDFLGALSFEGADWTDYLPWAAGALAVVLVARRFA